MRWVCLCLDAHNFVVGPAPRADEIRRMMHRSHVQPRPATARQQPTCCETKFTPKIWDCGGSPETRVRFGGGAISQPKPLIVALNAALIDRKMKARSADLGGAVPVFEPSGYCRRQSAKTGLDEGGARRCWWRFFCCGWKPSTGRRRNRDPRATLDSSLSRCRVQRGFCSWVGMELIFQMMLRK
jgi:hypothetical protein